MAKVYIDKDVYTAACERMEYIFDNFDNILVAFSGGKDSSVLLNLAYDYAKEHDMLHKLAMYHLDYEAQYQMTTEYVTDCFLNGFKGIRKYWVCLPVAAQCAVSMYQDHWTPWDIDKKDIWAREMPNNDYVINEQNVPFKFKKDTLDYEVQDNINEWFATEFNNAICLIGIRADESLNRFRSVKENGRAKKYLGKQYINKSDKSNCPKAYPLYDWTADDIWVANAKFGYKYNKLYDLYYQAGLNIDQMRVASPFNDCAVNTLKLYKVIEPHTWGKLVGRVNGVNFAGIYGGTTAMGWKNIKLPKGHTWESYMYFLLDTLPKEVRQGYLDRLETSKKFWRERGGALDDVTIEELKGTDLKFEVKGAISNQSTKEVVTFEEYPDDADVTNFKSIPTYKRMCICIMKNDHLCKYMGFAPTKSDKEKRKRMMDKYKSIIKGEL